MGLYAQETKLMARRLSTNIITLLVLIAVVLGTLWAVRRFHRPGQLDVLTAQAMDMSAMRPPTGAAPVALASVRRGALDDMVIDTGTVRAYNEQDISPRITGTVVALPVYPGDPVRAGQVVARLDTAEVSAKAAQADAEAQQARIAVRIAHLNHHLHHQAALDQASAQEEASEQAVLDAQGQANAAQDSVADAQAGVQSAQANDTYWKTEIVREKQLADAGAASQQEYQNELSQAQAADAALAQARSKVRQAQAMVGASHAKVTQAQRVVTASRAATRMAQADIAVAAGQADQDEAGAVAAQAAAREAAIVQGYAQITSPANGVVTERPIAPGTLVQPGTVLLKVAEIDRVRIQANVAVADVAGIGPGTSVTIAPQNSTMQPISARVTSIFPSANDQTRTAIVEIVIPNPGHRLLPGAFVTVRIKKTGVSDKTLVPASAIVSDGGSSYLWLASSTMTVHRMPVQAGASDGTWTEIAGIGIPEGSRVVTHGQAGLVENGALMATAWGADGPKTLPTMGTANHGQTLYKCEKCGMTYSEADAKRNNYIDPMDGGRLVPVKGQ